MSLVDVQELRRLVADATHGPWSWFASDASAGVRMPGRSGAAAWLGNIDGRSNHADAALIVALVNTAPAIFDEIEALRAEVEGLRPKPLPLQVRDAARRRSALDGADVQALEHAITITERERDDARAQVANASHTLTRAGFVGTLVEQVEALLDAKAAADAHAEALRHRIREM